MLKDESQVSIETSERVLGGKKEKEGFIDADPHRNCKFEGVKGPSEEEEVVYIQVEERKGVNENKVCVKRERELKRLIYVADVGRVHMLAQDPEARGLLY